MSLVVADTTPINYLVLVTLSVSRRSLDIVDGNPASAEPRVDLMGFKILRLNASTFSR